MTGRRARAQKQDVPLIQWIVSGIAVAVVLGSFGLIVHDGLIAHRGPPAISVAVDSIVRRGELQRVHVSVRNDGGAAAADVQVSGARNASAPPTTLRFDYLPAGARKSAVFVFAAGRDSAGPHVKLESWGEP